MHSKEHYAISSRCCDAMDGYFDQHVYDAMMYHDGAGTIALLAEERAAKAARRATPVKSRRTDNSDPLGFFAAIRRTRRA